MLLSRMSRGDLEAAVLAEDILPCDAAGLARIRAMTDAELMAAVGAWIEAGDECADAGRGPGR